MLGQAGQGDCGQKGVTSLKMTSRSVDGFSEA